MKRWIEIRPIQTDVDDGFSGIYLAARAKFISNRIEAPDLEYSAKLAFSTKGQGEKTCSELNVKERLLTGAIRSLYYSVGVEWPSCAKEIKRVIFPRTL